MAVLLGPVAFTQPVAHGGVAVARPWVAGPVTPTMPTHRSLPGQYESHSWYSQHHAISSVRVAMLQPGALLGEGRFCVQRCLGRGAMGYVYAVSDRERARPLALKTLRLQSPEAAYALKREFRALSDIAHPNLVRLHELFVDGFNAFFTMDLVEGVPFDRIAREHLERALTQLVWALHALHEAGKLHRDIKPANVLVQPDGRLVVLDFGLVLDQTREAQRREEAPGCIVGTPRYMAPEVLSWGKASEASDWFSVGVMLHETLTGRALDESALTRIARTAPPPGPSEVCERAPRQFDEICQALLDPEPSLRARGEDVLRALGVETAPPRSSAAPPPTELTGRGSHLGAMLAAFAEYRARGEATAIMVSGQSGMGKTVLLREFLRQHRRRGVTIFWGQCHEQEALSHKAFDEIIDQLGSYLIEEHTDDLFSIVRSEEAQHLLRLFPSLARVEALAPLADAGEGADPRALRKHAYEALRNVLARIGERTTLILVLDDLQWGDLDSARLLYELFSEWERPRCFLLLAYRSDEVASSECLQTLLSGARCLADVIEVRHVDVGVLDDADARSLAARLLGRVADQEGARSASVAPLHDPALAARIELVCREAAGSPLLLRELAELRQEELSASDGFGLVGVVRARLARVGELSRRVFELVCVAGVPIRENLLSVALGGARVDAALLELETECLIRERTSRGAGAVEVVHDGLRQAALSLIDFGKLRRLHEDLARAHVDLSEPDVEALARHYAGAKLRAEAAYWAQKAAERAKARLAFDHAADLYRNALQLADADSPSAHYLKVQLALALADAGRGKEAAPLLLELAETASPQTALEYRRLAAEQWLTSGRIERGLEVLRSVFRELGMSLPTDNAAAALALAGNRARVAWRGAKFTPRTMDEVEPREVLRVDACRAAWILNFVSTLQGAALQARFLRLALDLGEPSRVAMGLGIEALQASIEGRQEKRRALQSRARNLAEQLATPQSLGFQSLVEANCDYLAGNWRDCAEASQLAEEILTRRCRGSTWELNTLRFFWGMALYHQGRFRELRRRTHAWLMDAIDRGDRTASSAFRFNLARGWYLVQDDPARAHEQLEQGLREWGFPELAVHRFVAALARVQVYLYEGRLEAARKTAKELGSRFRTSTLRRSQLARIQVSHHIGYVALALAARNDGAERRSQLRRAAHHQQRLQREGAAWGVASANYLEAQRLLLEGRDSAGLAALAEALRAFEGCQMHAAAAATRFRLGQLTGGEQGQQHIAEAYASMHAQGARDARCLLTALAPGAGDEAAASD